MDIDELLVLEAKRLTGISGTAQVLEEALRTLIRVKSSQTLRGLRGQLRWEGDLSELRLARDLGDRQSRE